MFQTSSSAKVSAILKFSQDNPNIYNYQYNDSLQIKINVRYKLVKFKETNNIIENTTGITVKV